MKYRTKTDILNDLATKHNLTKTTVEALVDEVGWFVRDNITSLNTTGIKLPYLGKFVVTREKLLIRRKALDIRLEREKANRKEGAGEYKVGSTEEGKNITNIYATDDPNFVKKLYDFRIHRAKLKLHKGIITQEQYNSYIEKLRNYKGLDVVDKSKIN